ncbi:MAG: SDR family oxidoreductase [Lachnospiraceae bacterium]|nr:SDR family oxidoreductase [Lachnospiraceae bacterium]
MALVIGASEGIGRATAEKFVRNGMNVVVFSRRKEVCSAVAMELQQGSGRKECAISVAGSIDSEEDLQMAVKETIKTYGRLDVLVNVAAAQGAGTVMDAMPEDYEKMFRVNLMGYGLSAKAAIPELLKSEHPAIVNIASLNGCIGVPNRLIYNCTKAAVIEMTQCIACDFPSIRTNCISPGFTASESMMTGLSVTGIAPEQCEKLISSGTLMKRMAKPEEIANIVAFLASDEASYITGQNIIADGGALCFGNYDYEMTKFLREKKD